MQKHSVIPGKMICTIILIFVAKCLQAQPMTLTLTPASYNGYNISCFGVKDGSIDLRVTGGRAPFTFLWSNKKTTEDISGVAAGYYRVRVTDSNGATADGEVTLEQPDQIRIDVTANTYANGYNVSAYNVCDGNASANVSGGVTPYTYAWSDNNSNQSRTNLCARTYGVSTTDKNGCKLSSAKIYITEPTRNDWQMAGNANVNAANQFLGTTDNNDLLIKTNNVEQFRIKGDGKASFSRTLNLENGITFNSVKQISYQIAQGSNNEILSFGAAPNNQLKSIATCASPFLNTQLNYQFNGTIQLWGNSYMGGNLNVMEVGFDGANAIIDATGTSADPIANRLLLNYYCGHDVFVGNSISGDLNANHNFFVSGQASIGTGNLDPAYRLQVNGAIRAKKVVVEIGWADYVFHKDYKLMSLVALDNYISTHNHLPNIPSTKEIEEKGLDIGELQAKQMEKIEEMALYIIQLNKKIEEQDKRIEELENVRQK
ncbi:MAG: SprB repeat-containing protein [Bacteroidota bacterium]